MKKALITGITGWAQVNGRDELSIPIKVSYDQYYLNNRSLLLNIKIIILTAFKVLGMDGVSH
ncbi:MAG: sugar transferase [Candidatus Marinimicrobia bacterium]|nr:sugar transferase [Candidatus Neomarinimicrobiota bacterium]